MYVVVYGTSGAQGAECGFGDSIPEAKSDALRRHNRDLHEDEHIHDFAVFVEKLAQVEFTVLIVRVWQWD